MAMTSGNWLIVKRLQEDQPNQWSAAITPMAAPRMTPTKGNNTPATPVGQADVGVENVGICRPKSINAQVQMPMHSE